MKTRDFSIIRPTPAEPKAPTVAHTATPWKEGPNCVYVGNIIDKDDSYLTVAECLPHNAALIVRAVNSHDELVAALRDLLAVQHTVGDSEAMRQDTRDRFDKARVALAKAEA